MIENLLNTPVDRALPSPETPPVRRGSARQREHGEPGEPGTLHLRTGLTREIVAEISRQKDEPEWMREFRLAAFEIFQKTPLSPECAELSRVNLETLDFLRVAPQTTFVTWEAPEVTFSEDGADGGVSTDGGAAADSEARLNRKIQNAAIAAESDSSGLYHNLSAEWKKLGVLFLSPEEALKKHPDLFREHFATVVAPGENKLAALNSAVWSGGTFIYVPKGVIVNVPLQTQLRLSRNLGQFERTLIVVDEGAFVHYVEGCSATPQSTDLLHAGVVEIVVKRGGRCRFTTIQNFATNVYNVVTKGAIAMRDATVQWVDGNIGSRLTIKHPFVKLLECGARAEISAVAFAGKGQHHDIGARIIHAAPNTHSHINSRAASRTGGRATLRGACSILKGADSSQCRIASDGLVLDALSRVDAFPRIEVAAENVNAKNESWIRGLGSDQIFYLESRGLAHSEAVKLILDGFLEPLITELPMEYAVEMKRLIELEMEDAG